MTDYNSIMPLREKTSRNKKGVTFLKEVEERGDKVSVPPTRSSILRSLSAATSFRFQFVNHKAKDLVSDTIDVDKRTLQDRGQNFLSNSRDAILLFLQNQ
jgi:hypothetical protein